MSNLAIAFHAGPVPVDLFDGLRAYADRFGLDWRHDELGFHLFSTRGQTAFCLEPQGMTVMVTGLDPAAQHQLCEGAVFVLDQLCPAISAQIEWSGFAPEGNLPPSMHLARLWDVTRIGPNTLRVELDCAETGQMMQGGMHFSLILPPKGRPPVWPALNARGRTVWPDGAHTLHRAVFTFVGRDALRQRVVFDMFAHEGSPATDWALGTPNGSQVLLSGPGGGEVPTADRLILAGDETALPAIRAILRERAGQASGHVLIEVGDLRDQLLGPVPDGFGLTVVHRQTGAALTEALSHIADQVGPDDFLWVAADAEAVRTTRELYVIQRGHSRKNTYLAAYWSRR